MWWFIGMVVVALALFALAWWSSGRSRRRLGHPDARAETDRGRAINQAMINRDVSGNHL